MPSETKTFSARMNPDVMKRLERRGREAGVSKSRLAERYIDEGLRIDSHPGVIFRGGAGGRRAALQGGPDIWQVIEVLKAGKGGEPGIAETAEWLDLSPEQVRMAIRYYAEFAEEIDERIRRNEERARQAEAAWRREQAALAG